MFENARPCNMYHCVSNRRLKRKLVSSQHDCTLGLFVKNLEVRGGIGWHGHGLELELELYCMMFNVRLLYVVAMGVVAMMMILYCTVLYLDPYSRQYSTVCMQYLSSVACSVGGSFSSIRLGTTKPSKS